MIYFPFLQMQQHDFLARWSEIIFDTQPMLILVTVSPFRLLENSDAKHWFEYAAWQNNRSSFTNGTIASCKYVCLESAYR